MRVSGHDTLGVRRRSRSATSAYDYFSLARGREARWATSSRLPFSLKVLLENLLRFEDGRTVTVDQLEAHGRLARGRAPPTRRSPTGRPAC